MEDILKIGLVVKPQGIKGELKVKPLTDDSARFKKLKNVLIDGKTYKVNGVKIVMDFVFLSLCEVPDRNTAEEFRGKFLCVKKEDAVELPENSFFIVDILGAKLFTETKEIGTITEVTNAKTDYFTVKTTEGKTMRFPFLKDLLISVDTQNKKVVVHEKRLNEVSFYED